MSGKFKKWIILALEEEKKLTPREQAWDLINLIAVIATIIALFI